MQPKLYRLKHVPTGMYFCPSREIKVKIPDGNDYQKSGVYVKSNLSVKGKIYQSRPTLMWVKPCYYTHLITSVQQLNSHGGCMIPYAEGHWIVEEVNLEG